MKNILYIIISCTLIGLLSSCNPECENFSRVDAVVTPVDQNGQKFFLINFNIPSFLDNRALYTEKVANGQVVINAATVVSVTPQDDGYLIAEGELSPGNFNFYISDNDCGGFVPINTVFECESLSGVLADVSPSIRKAGNQIKVTTNPANFLADKELYIQRGNEPIDVNSPIQSEFRADIGGRIARIPADAAGNANVFIEDKDCGGFIPISSVRVADNAFIAANPGQFVTPTPPNIIISPPSIAPPTNVVNTWFSADNRGYCIWFLPRMVWNGKCYTEQKDLLPGVSPPVGGTNYTNLDTLDRIGSWELRVGACSEPDANFHLNPVSGTVDHETGEVNFVVDRSSKTDAQGNSLGFEQYVGNIVSTSSLPLYAQHGGICVEDEMIQSESIMVVTSQKTGYQMILFRQNAFGVDERFICQE